MTPKRRNLELLFNNTTVVPFKIAGKYGCFFCDVQLSDRQQLIKHNQTHLPCSVDDKPFQNISRKEWEVNVDVSEIKCNKCPEQFNNIVEIGFHLLHKHSLSYDVNTKIRLTLFRLVDFKCVVCDTEFKNLRNLTVHNRNEHRDLYKCDHCGKTFEEKAIMERHIIGDHIKKIKCSECMKDFKSKADYLKHMNEDHISQCCLCLKLFSSSALRRSHMKTEHDMSRGGTCGFCQKKCTSLSGILGHASICSAGDRNKTVDEVVTKIGVDTSENLKKNMIYVLNNTTVLPFNFFSGRIHCFSCAKDFKRCEDFRSHTTTVHPKFEAEEKVIRNLPIKIDSSILKCKLCENESQDFRSLLGHLEFEHNSKLGSCADKFQPFKLIDDNYACPQCDKEFPLFAQTYKHFTVEHMLNKCICIYCGKSFHNSKALNSHTTKYHTGQLRFKCTECDSAFVYKSQLVLHKGAAHNKKFVKCSYCPEMFATYDRKKYHEVKLHGEGYKCPHCVAVFVSHGSLNDHVRSVHLKEKNVKCRLCDREFYDKHLLNIHMRVHTGVKPFSCEHCDKAFSIKSKLAAHMSVHSNERAFNCKLCDKKFKNKPCLKQHMNLHKPERGFECDYCTKKFTWRQNLRSHMKVHFAKAGRQE